jgi:hypothetical protein
MFIRSTSGTPKFCNLSFPGQNRMDNLWKAASRTPDSNAAAAGLYDPEGRVCFLDGALRSVHGAFLDFAARAAQVAEYLANHSRATSSKLFAAQPARADFIALRFSLGSIPLASSLRDVSRRSRASFKLTSG